MNGPYDQDPGQQAQPAYDVAPPPGVVGPPLPADPSQAGYTPSAPHIPRQPGGRGPLVLAGLAAAAGLFVGWAVKSEMGKRKSKYKR